jgi:GWxTD domain-containing protein
MNRVIYLLLIISILFLLPSLASPEKKVAAEQKVAPLSEAHKKFLEDVFWIISDYEKNAFLSLKNDADKDRFITAFWDNRDPTPGTTRNEFQEEHYKRLEYANKYYGRESALPGSKTDRGRVYVLLGKPEFIKRFPGSFDFYPTELWHYVGYKGYGLPSSLYFLFYQNRGIGAYKLYSPLQDGVASLANPEKQNQYQTDEQLLDRLEEKLDPEVAHAAVTSIPSDSADVSSGFGDLAGIGTEMIQAKVQNARNFEVDKRKYVEDILRDRPVVQVFYSVGTEGIRDGFYCFQAPNGIFYLHYAVEYQADKLDMGQYEDYYTSLSLDGQISTPDRIVVDQILGSHEIKLTANDFQRVKSWPFQLQGIKPIVPGKYIVTLILNNNVSRKSVTFTHDIEIPDVSNMKAPYVTTLLPIRKAETVSDQDRPRIRPFQFGDNLYTPNIPGETAQTSAMQIYHQVIFPETFRTDNGTVVLDYLIRVGDKVESQVTQELNYSTSQLAGNAIDIRKEIPLTGLALGRKELVVQLKQGDKVLAQSPPYSFSVAPEVNQSIWKFSIAIPNYDSPYHAFTLAQQYLRLNKTNEAFALLKEAQQESPESTEIKLLLMRVALKGKDYAKVLEIGSPLEVKNPRNKDLLWLIGWAYYGSGKYDDAVRFFERYRLEDPNRTEVLNILADSYFRLSQPTKSLERLKQSLALRPDQPDILELKKKIESMPQ